MTDINTGNLYTFKRSKGRGRPFVGEVVKKMGAVTVMRMKDGTEVNVQTKMIRNPYSFKPYNTKGRSNEQAA